MHNAGMVCGRLCWVVWGLYVVGMCRCESRGMKKESLTSIRRLKISDSPLSPAVRTRLELATPGVTGRYSNRLNYRTKKFSGNFEGIDFRSQPFCLSLEWLVSLSFAVAKLGRFFDSAKYFCNFFATFFEVVWCVVDNQWFI